MRSLGLCLVLVGLMLFFGCSAEEMINTEPEMSTDAEDQFLFPEISAPGAVEAAPASPGVDANWCDDSDGGYDIHTKGTALIMENGKETTVAEDFCLDSSMLKEYYCSGKTLLHDTVKCTCSNGVCAPIVEYTECRDSDLGNEKLVKGQIQLVTHYSDGSEVKGDVQEDHCISDTGLIEYFCGEGGSIRKYTYTCLYCVNGACTN